MNRYAGFGAGQVVQTENYELAVVEDFIIRKREQQFVRWDADSTRYRIDKVKTPVVERIVVRVPRRGRWRGLDGRLLSKKVKLSKQETKTLMLQALVQRNKLHWLVRMYPEEQPNLPVLVAKYAPPEGFPPARYMPPSLYFSD